MSIRFFLVGIIWTVIMLLLFTTPVSDEATVYFGYIPSRSIIHGLLFWGFSHIWLSTCKRQGKFEVLRRKSFQIVAISSLSFAVLAELGMFLFGVAHFFSWWNLAFDAVGAGMGMLSFRLLYDSCY